MNELEKFWRDADEAHGLNARFFSAFPVRRNEGILKQRHADGDRNVRCSTYENGERSYELVFTREQKAILLDAYKKARPGYDERMDKGTEAKVFVGTLESWGDSLQLFAERKPKNQKDRVRAIEKINVALLKLDEALHELDSGSLGYWYAHVVDATAKAGHQLSATDGAWGSMLSKPVRAIVEAGEFRQKLRPLIASWVESTKTAAETNPKFDHQEHDERLGRTKALERMVIEHGIPFDTSEGGFPAVCLRAIFDLGGVDVEKVHYWLKKVADDPDSFARFSEKMRKKYGGENPPPV